MQVAIIALKLSYSRANVQAMHGKGGRRLNSSDFKADVARYSIAQGIAAPVGEQVCSISTCKVLVIYRLSVCVCMHGKCKCGKV